MSAKLGCPCNGASRITRVWSLSWPILLKSRCGMSGTPLERPQPLEGEKRTSTVLVNPGGGAGTWWRGLRTRYYSVQSEYVGGPKRVASKAAASSSFFFSSGGEYCQAFPIHQRPHLPSPTNTPHKARVCFAPWAGLKIVGVNLHRLLEEKPQTPGPSAEYPQIQGPDPQAIARGQEANASYPVATV